MARALAELSKLRSDLRVTETETENVFTWTTLGKTLSIRVPKGDRAAIDAAMDRVFTLMSTNATKVTGG